jgi:hypothetical protein
VHFLLCFSSHIAFEIVLAQFSDFAVELVAVACSRGDPTQPSHGLQAVRAVILRTAHSAPGYHFLWQQALGDSAESRATHARWERI